MGPIVNTSGNTPAGLGTFHGKFVGDNFVLEFIPDIQVGVTTVKAFNEVFYKDLMKNSNRKSQ